MFIAGRILKVLMIADARSLLRIRIDLLLRAIQPSNTNLRQERVGECM